MAVPAVTLADALAEKNKEAAFETPAESPAIRALKGRVAAGDRAAVEAFWREAKAKGAPLIEAVPGDAEHSLLTFLWRGGDETRNVAIVVQEITSNDPGGALMERIPGTDVWHRTFKARSDFRNTYRLSPNDSLVSIPDVLAKAKDSEERRALLAERKKTWQRDPLNPHQFCDDPPDVPYSTIALPAATLEPYLDDVPQAGVPKGKVKQETFHSALLNEDKLIWVYTPPGYKRNKGPYPLLIHFDGKDRGKAP